MDDRADTRYARRQQRASLTPAWRPSRTRTLQQRLTVAVLLVLAAGPAAAEQLQVDGAWAGITHGTTIAPGLRAGINAFATIQPAIDAAPSGGVVNVAAGSYVEQVVIDGKDLTLKGAGVGATTIVSPTALALSFVVGSFTNKPVLLCTNASNIQVSDLTVDGNGQGNTNERFLGIAYLNAGGSISDVNVVRMRNTPRDNAQHGTGVYSQTTMPGPFTLECAGVSVEDYQKNGFALAGAAMTVDVHDCSVTGSGDIVEIAQNGIQLGPGAQGVIRDSRVSSIRYTPLVAVAAGVLVTQPGGPVTLSGFKGANAFYDVQAPVRWYDGSGTIDGIEVTGPIIAGQDFGPIVISNFTGGLEPTGARGATGPPSGPPAVPFEEDWGGALRTSQMMATHSVLVNDACLTGADAPGTTGIYAYSSGGPLNVSVTNSVLHDWDTALLTLGIAAKISAYHNSIVSNLSAGYDNSGSATSQVAEANWWGAANGPGGTGPGSGDAIVGPNVDVTPWLLSGGDADPGCGFGPAEVVSASTSATCISTNEPCATVDISITRSTTTGVRAFSVPIQLSPNLELCAGTASIVEGSYLSAIGPTTFLVIDHGGGSYTVDGAILGLPCGGTAPGGTLFTLAVKKAPGPDGTGSVTVGTPLLRDCDNLPMAAAAGTPATILIDTAGPLPVGTLAATQIKTGNDTDGTTKIQLTFTPPGDATSVEVYRAGFGNYPEYDDGPGAGSVPATPSYPPSAPWALTPVAASGETDEVTQRDVWYYVMFSRDACGNVSTVSNQTSGTLNYHLGDVSDGIVAGQGNNRVLSEDVSLLGAHYSTLLSPGHPRNFLDVGPTVDRSVNTRPLTDNRIDFEDLIVFALNYSLVTAPQRASATPSADNSIGLAMPALPATGERLEVALQFEGRGDVHGLSVRLRYDPDVVEPAGVAEGRLLSAQGRGAVMLSPAGAAVDLALLGPGAGLLGAGELARLAFRVKRHGDPGIEIDEVIARNGQNEPVSIGAESRPVARDVTPARVWLGPARPNPARHDVQFELQLPRESAVELMVFDLSGRRVRTLVKGNETVGVHFVRWDGRDDSGQLAPAGFYLVRLEAAEVTQSRRVRVIR